MVVDLIDENQFINSIAGPKFEDDSIVITSTPKSGSIKKTFTLTSKTLGTSEMYKSRFSKEFVKENRSSSVNRTLDQM